MKEQACINCYRILSITEFEHQKNRPNPRKVCKECRHNLRDKEKEKKRHREYMKERRKKEPDALRINWERHVYGKAKEDLGVKECMICSSTKRLCIDHSHDTKEIRGVLCHLCNLGIGAFRDNTEYLKLAIKYLDKHK